MLNVVIESGKAVLYTNTERQKTIDERQTEVWSDLPTLVST